MDGLATGCFDLDLSFFCILASAGGTTAGAGVGAGAGSAEGGGTCCTVEGAGDSALPVPVSAALAVFRGASSAGPIPGGIACGEFAAGVHAVRAKHKARLNKNKRVLIRSEMNR
ncbi:hypothetical protein YDYSG_66200 [Paenibacillus tyrfis]|nr:hypothetical protein YDYSG_66200 [Paenibacillus tyrfis]